ncbi:phosphatidylglycerol lysyltransferase domain-containing protein [uncultured Thioclava sp.]|uniref:phosphatidylglycerol lysyltransferase domain-containing protein n=1 Tax=uncultured Thioclava sp. TaxID=473858 RepID=UPI0025DA7002|nr:phosphatidylglycerol lysyltransferase domain-containing protein [uncultured Thioclava sp.]
MAQHKSSTSRTGSARSALQARQMRLPGWAGALRRQIVVIALLAGFALLLRERIAALDWGAIAAAFAQVSPLQWTLAALASACSFAALANYDALLHRALGTGQPPERARRAGWVAIAISQTVGFGLISGALVRWRMLPGMSLLEASRLTAAVAASFLAAWAVLGALVLIALPVPLADQGAWAVRAMAGIALLLGGVLTGVALWKPGMKIARWHLRLPTLPVMGRLLWLCLLDTAFAALALWLLLPTGCGIGALALYPAFLIALGAGFVSGSPGGVGPFEVTLLALLPQPETAPLLAAILAWRLVYYGAPALLAMAVLALSDRAHPARLRPHLVPPAPVLTPRLAHLIGQSDQPELGLLRQGEHSVLLSPDARSGWMIGRTSQALIGLLDPFGDVDMPTHLAQLRENARDEGRIACAYKLGPRSASIARKSGWHVTPVALECWLDLSEFQLATPARAGLRRKLRKAEKAGVCCAFEAAPDAGDLARIAAVWAHARGAERGFSMGRFNAAYVADQAVIVARHNGAIIGFASFHTGHAAWVLDLMRPAPDAPDGTMHALILAAIDAARACGVSRVSLAALPPRAADIAGPARKIWDRAEKGASAAGLRQFKMGFAPRLSPRYIAAPSRGALMLGAADVARAIHAPPALCVPSQTPVSEPNEGQIHPPARAPFKSCSRSS